MRTRVFLPIFSPPFRSPVFAFAFPQIPSCAFHELQIFRLFWVRVLSRAGLWRRCR